ncbi:MAG: VPDSG-CTERM sorting domain-containing protein [Chthoniobacterales bacterium]
MTKLRFTLLSLGLVNALVVFGPVQTRADEFAFTSSIPLTGGGFISGSGFLFTAGPLSPAGTLVTSIVGSYDAGTITGLLAPGTLGGNDNLLFSGYPSLNGNGISFSVSGEADPAEYGAGVNLYFSFTSAGYTDNSGKTDYSPTGFTLVPVAAPETGSTLGLLLLSLVGLLGVRRFRVLRVV